MRRFICTALSCEEDEREPSWVRRDLRTLNYFIAAECRIRGPFDLASLGLPALSSEVDLMGETLPRCRPTRASTSQILYVWRPYGPPLGFGSLVRGRMPSKSEGAS